jgi:nonsense-mediated mRNA decay protein 3
MSDGRSRTAPCPSCGAPVEPGARDPTGRGGELCADCYFERFDLVSVPDRVEITVCPTCGAVERGRRWVDVDADDYVDVAVDAVADRLEVHVDAEEFHWEVRPEQKGQTEITVHARFEALVRGRHVETDRSVPVSVGHGTCERCGRAAGDYHEAIVQVRAADRSPAPDEREGAREVVDAYLAEREQAGDRDAFVASIDEDEDGIDVKVSTAQIGRAVAERVVRRYGGTVSDARRLVSEDGDGERLYRMTYTVRLPAFRPGDVIDPGDDGGPVLVTNVKGGVGGVRLESGEQFRAPVAADREAAFYKLGTADDAAETALVSVEDEHAVQVLDPETYETVTVARPDFLDPEAETVEAIHTTAGTHILPEDALSEGDGDGSPTLDRA